MQKSGEGELHLNELSEKLQTELSLEFGTIPAKHKMDKPNYGTCKKWNML